MTANPRLWLLLPVWLCLAGDIAMTLAGQTAEFWAGDYSQALEGNPLALPVLQCGPQAFIAFALLWAVVLGIVGFRLSTSLAGPGLALVAVSHAVGGSTWLWRHGYWGMIFAVLYLIVAAEACGWCWRQAIRTQAEPL